MKEQIKILIVDDEKVIRNMLKEHLTDEGFSVVAVPSGEAALEVFRGDPNHLVITDIRMGGMSGVQLLGEVKKLDEHALVIIITSHASLDNAVATLKAGAFDYIFKPFQDLETVTEVVNRGMHKITLLHENRGLMEDLEQNNLRMEQSNEELKELVIRDGLTGLFNHRHFKEVLEREVARAARYERSLCLIMVDVDHFKNYNDTHGHPAGDEVLKTLADIISGRLRAVDLPARYGGEEFVILLPETERPGGNIVAEDIRAQVENFPFKGRESQPLGKVTISLGLAEFPDDADESSLLLKKADDALYRAKSEGRNLVVWASEQD
ncbi:diguanylate cyclase [bacterium]|nr:diguanylate cyclase [bacterium]